MLHNRSSQIFPFLLHTYLSLWILVLACPDGKYNDQKGLNCTGDKRYNFIFTSPNIRQFYSRIHYTVCINSAICFLWLIGFLWNYYFAVLRTLLGSLLICEFRRSVSLFYELNTPLQPFLHMACINCLFISIPN